MTAAPGGPGLSPTWTSSAKDVVTTAVGGRSQIWLTLGHGIANEIYWPSTGQPQLRDLGFLVSHPGGWTEVKRANQYRIELPGPSSLVPTTIHHGEGWELRLDWAIDPDRDVVLVSYELSGAATGLCVLAAPHLGSGSCTNTAWTDGELHAVADDQSAALTVTGSVPFAATSVGFVGASDAWQDFAAHGEFTWRYELAERGNVALAADLGTSGVLAIGFATTADGATVLARSSLAAGFDLVRRRFVDAWDAFAAPLDASGVDERWRSMTLHSAAVLACHEDRTYPGASVASLSIPWGNDRADLGGYHLVWARDAVESALGRLALGDRAAAERTLRWLIATQKDDGHWTQNAFPDGHPYWTGIQLDEVALPIVLAAALDVPSDDGPVIRMVEAAARYLVAHGPSSLQDRWEEDAGTNPFTLATVVAALVTRPDAG
ncbi:MAG: glycoside hydrolase family 15 protein [Ilumatobacteraceae bacterium]